MPLDFFLGEQSHLLAVDRPGVVVNLVEIGAVLATGEDVSPTSSDPAVLVESEQRSIHAHVRAPFVHPVRVTGARPGEERNPRGELPLHLHVEVGRALELLQQVGDTPHATRVALAIAAFQYQLREEQSA